MVNIDLYKQRLLAEERKLTARIKRAAREARETTADVQDWGDRVVIDEVEDEQLAEARIEWARLKQVRDALKRIDDGTFGQCIVDGGPIEEERLEAESWTPYCLKHQQQIERSNPTSTPTL